MKKPINLVVLPLKEAVYCADCDSLTNTKSSNCPNCASVALFNLANILDWQPIQDVQLAKFLNA